MVLVACRVDCFHVKKSTQLVGASLAAGTGKPNGNEGTHPGDALPSLITT